MDKKTEIALQKARAARRGQPAPGWDASLATAASGLEAEPLAAGSAATAAAPPSGWWMYHGDPAHTGCVTDSPIDSATVGSLVALHTLSLGGPVLSVPAVSDGFVYVGLANYAKSQGGNGGALHKIAIDSGEVVRTFAWDLGTAARDAHSFTGMGSTPAVTGGRVYFGAFNGAFYCLDSETLDQLWVTNLRSVDPVHRQPVTNTAGVDQGLPPAVMWSSPVVSADGRRVFVGCGEGENPELFSFVFCLDASSGHVVWLFCTNQFVAGTDNAANAIPAGAVPNPPALAGYQVVADPPVIMGCSVWGSIAYDAGLDRLYCPTGNQAPEPNGNWTEGPFTHELPSPGYSNGLLSLDASTGAFKGFFQVLADSNYRDSDIDVDVGASPILFVGGDGSRRVGFACKNGGCFVLDADTMALLAWRQLLPYHRDGSRIASVDPHTNASALSPPVSNQESDATPGENFSGAFNTPAFHPGAPGPPAVSPRLFIGLGGPNYHSASPGIDSATTPFMRAIDAATLEDAWPLDRGDPPRYQLTGPPMYTNVGESGLSSPAVVNDVVFCSTSQVGLYAFHVADGRPLWQDLLGSQTDGYNGGYGYCLGPAIWKGFVVAGGLIAGHDGGILKIYGFKEAP